MVLIHDAEKGLMIADVCCIVFNVIMLLFELIIIIRFLVPLRIKSPYILLFYILLGIMLIANILEAGTRVYNGDPGFLLNW